MKCNTNSPILLAIIFSSLIFCLEDRLVKCDQTIYNPIKTAIQTASKAMNAFNLVQLFDAIPIGEATGENINNVFAIKNQASFLTVKSKVENRLIKKTLSIICIVPLHFYLGKNVSTSGTICITQLSCDISVQETESLMHFLLLRITSGF